MPTRFKLATIVLAVALASLPATAQQIGVFGGIAEQSHCIMIPAPGPFTLYVRATLGPVAGLQGASFRVTGLPAAWFYQILPQGPGIPCDFTPCDPFQLPGADIAWAECRQESEVVLVAVTGFATTVASNVELRVLARMPPQDPQFDCPVFNVCDSNFTSVCVGGATSIINPTAACPIGVEPQSWSVVKTLYD